MIVPYIGLISIIDMSPWSSLFLNFFVTNVPRPCRTSVSRQVIISMKGCLHLNNLDYFVYIHRLQVWHLCTLDTGAGRAFWFLQNLYGDINLFEVASKKLPSCELRWSSTTPNTVLLILHTYPGSICYNNLATLAVFWHCWYK